MGGGMMGGQQGQMMEPERSQSPRSESAGEKIFNNECASCHSNGGNIIVPGLPLSGSRILVNLKTFESFIRSPKMPDGSQGAMPPFPASKISEHQAKELYQFIKSADWYGTRGGYGMGPGMMGGYGYGMGPGMMGGYGYGMGPGMMGGYGYGMGPGMMGGYGYGMGSGSSVQRADCQKFYDETAKLRKELHDRGFEYFEMTRDPKTTAEKSAKLQKEIADLREKIYSKAPHGCW
jgi:Cytochrome C oxidase, cbb3-type, subunit III